MIATSCTRRSAVRMPSLFRNFSQADCAVNPELTGEALKHVTAERSAHLFLIQHDRGLNCLPCPGFRTRADWDDQQPVAVRSNGIQTAAALLEGKSNLLRMRQEIPP